MSASSETSGREWTMLAMVLFRFAISEIATIIAPLSAALKSRKGILAPLRYPPAYVFASASFAALDKLSAGALGRGSSGRQEDDGVRRTRGGQKNEMVSPAYARSF